jgi:formate hydrogenlyase subunit 3/multisubunit Na+/H+ antiporter MnhD subunit
MTGYSEALLWLVPLSPLALLPLLLLDREGRRALTLAVLAPLPAVWASLALPLPVRSGAEWLLLGTTVSLDETGRLFLFLTGLLWFLAALYATGYLSPEKGSRRFALFWLLTLSGNLTVVVAGDVAAFYGGFALMTFAAYGLVVHDGSERALRAGRVYIIMAILGELLLLAGILAAVASAETTSLEVMPAAVAASPVRDVVIALLYAGFGIKAGALLLHMWLPLAHPVAPVPASAVLSGCMIKAGLLGWLRFLPLGEDTLTGWGVLITAAGLAAAFLGVAAGLLQTDAKTNLAYSSISQMGIMTSLVGIGLATPGAGDLTRVVCAVYAVHHGFAKGALFLGVGVLGGGRLRRRLVGLGLLFAALSLAAAPFTSGGASKVLIKEVAGLAPTGLGAATLFFLPLTSIATTLLMGRFLTLTLGPAWKPSQAGRRLLVGWTLTLAAVLLTTWLLPAARAAGVGTLPLPYQIWETTWPVALGGLGLWLALRAGQRLRLALPLLPPGDLVVPIEGLASGTLRFWRRAGPATARTSRGLVATGHSSLARLEAGDRLAAVERRLLYWRAAGAALLFVAAVFVLLMMGPWER